MIISTMNRVIHHSRSDYSKLGYCRFIFHEIEAFILFSVRRLWHAFKLFYAHSISILNSVSFASINVFFYPFLHPIFIKVLYTKKIIQNRFSTNISAYPCLFLYFLFVQSFFTLYILQCCITKRPFIFSVAPLTERGCIYVLSVVDPCLCGWLHELQLVRVHCGLHTFFRSLLDGKALCVNCDGENGATFL